MNERQIAELRRADKQARLLGTRHPICRVCGISDRRVRFERHHVVARFAGRRLCEATVILCRRCHDRVSDMQKDLPVLDPSINPALAVRINRARGEAQLLALVAEQRIADADELLAIALAERLQPEADQ